VIIFVNTPGNDHQIPWYFETYGAPFRDRLASVHYADLIDDPEPRAATYCFGDLELLPDEQLVRAAELRRRLLARGCRVLNDPERTLRRYDLIRVLRREGINDFTAYREHEAFDRGRFPVFVRREHDHAGARSDLLGGAHEVQDTIGKLRADDPKLSDLLVVEFCDTADAHGVYRKYAAFRVGDAIIARHLFLGHQWHLKEAELRDPASLQEECDYVTMNPHTDVLRPIFELAGVEYGRIDYAFDDGRIRVWEINTNPTILQPLVRAAARRSKGPILDAVDAMARAVLRPVVRTRAGRRLRATQLAARTERRPRAKVNREFAGRLATAWAAIDHQVTT
jgi:hypothetical protein